MEYDIYRSLKEELDTGWPWPLSAVQDWFEKLYNKIQEWISNAVSAILDRLAGKIWDWWDKARHSLRDNFRDAFNRTLHWCDVMPSPYRHVMKFLAFPVAMLYTWLEPLFKWLRDRAWGFTRWLQARLFEHRKWLKDRVWDNVRWLRDRLVDVRDDLFNRVKTAFDGAVKGMLETFRDALKGFVEWLLDSLKWFAGKIIGTVNAFIGWFESFFTQLFSRLIHAITGYLKAHSPPEEIAEAVNSMYLTMWEELERSITEAYHSPPSPEALVLQAQNVVIRVIGASAAAEAGAAAGDAAHPTKQLQIKSVVKDLLEWLGVGAVASTPMMIMMETGLFRPLRYMYNKKFQPYVPREEDLAEMFVKGIIGYDEYIEAMAKQGYRYTWAQRMAEAEYRIPSFSELREMVWRAGMSVNTLRAHLRLQGVPPWLLDKYEKLIPQLPGISDLITFVVREVIPPKLFYVLAAKMGLVQDISTIVPKAEAMFKEAGLPYLKNAAEWYWAAHWVLPSFENVREAFWRGIITEDEFKKYIVWHDYIPMPRPGIHISDQELMASLSYKLPGRIDARWMLRWRVIDTQEHMQLLRMDGLHPDWQQKVAEAEWRNLLVDERTALRNVYIRKYRLGLITEDELRARLEALYYTPREVAWIVQRAKEEYEMDLLEDKVDAAKQAYRKDLLTDEEFLNMLLEWGIREERARLIVAEESFKKMPRP